MKGSNLSETSWEVFICFFDIGLVPNVLGTKRLPNLRRKARNRVLITQASMAVILHKQYHNNSSRQSTPNNQSDKENGIHAITYIGWESTAFWRQPLANYSRLGRDMGGVQNVWGEENVPENALSRKFLDPSKRAFGLLFRGFLYRKNRALTPEGGGKRTVRGGVQNPFLGGVPFVRFSTPLLFPPPHGVL